MGILRLSLSLAFFLTLAGCATLPTGSGGVIGTLRVSGPNVLLNNAPGSDGDQVTLGSTLVTGPGSGARLDFRDGGYLQLGQNTDPVFEWLEQSKCILIRILRGQAYLKRERACVQGANISMVLDSEANIRIEEGPGVAEVTLIRGRAAVSAPTAVTLSPGQQLTVTGRGVVSLRALTPAELRAATAWSRSYRFRPLPAPEPEGGMILFPGRPKPPPSRSGAPAKPAPETSAPPASAPSSTVPLQRGIRVPPAPIERSPEPVIR